MEQQKTQQRVVRVKEPTQLRVTTNPSTEPFKTSNYDKQHSSIVVDWNLFDCCSDPFQK
jgi:hypothetical protein